jgi:hypothetical protein
MELFALLMDILTYFRPVFQSQNFALFCECVIGLVLSPSTGRKTLTTLWQQSRPDNRYWSLPKFLSRGKWCHQQLALRLLSLLVSFYEEWVYVFDLTHAIKSGKKQFGLHFFPNHRYQKKNKNQSKFHWGHQFAALGLLAITSSGAGVILFPFWVRMLIPQDLKLNCLSLFESIVKNIPKGLIIFDRGFNNRKIFAILLQHGHQLLVRAKSNAVFYRLPASKSSKNLPKGKRKKGRKPIYGKRLDVRRMRYRQLEIAALGKNKRVSVASQLVRTKMCPSVVRLVIIRTKPKGKKNKPYRYFMVYTSKLDLTLERIISLYHWRWGIETAIRDAKENFGFDHYQLHSQKSIESFVQLSFVATSLTQLIFSEAFNSKGLLANSISVKEVLSELDIHWYHPKHLTRGLMKAYLIALWMRHPFLMRKCFLAFSKEIHQIPMNP